MLFFVRHKLLPKCSIKNTVWLVVLIFLHVFLYYWLFQNLSWFVTNIISTTPAYKPNETIKFILLTRSHITYLNRITESNDCSVSNCVITDNKNLFNGDYTRFDAIIFDEYHLKDRDWVPFERLSSQLYIFTTQESASNYPACELRNDDFFNWTFTYRLDADIPWRYFVVRNISGDIVAPSKTVEWSVTKDPVPKEIKANFAGRTRAAAWIVSNCKAQSLRDQYLTRLQEHLYHYSLQIDVFGRCSGVNCEGSDCHTMLKRNYYFYMAFENSFAEDYVSEKVLHGYSNFVVPIVYGGANYSRILPAGSYINAREIHPYHLAQVMVQAINNPEIYESYFHWTNLYTIQDGRKCNPGCDLCKAVNSKEAKHAPANKNFRLWWNTLQGMKWCLSEEFWEEYAVINPENGFTAV